MELEKKIRFSILDLAEEDSYGSWELWWGVKQDVPEIKDENILRKQFLDIVEMLIKEKKLIALSYTQKDNTYKEVSLNRSRLEFESRNTDKIDYDTYYWFEATEDGRKEYNELYKEINGVRYL